MRAHKIKLDREEGHVQFMKSYVLKKRGLNGLMIKRKVKNDGVQSEPYGLYDSDANLELLYKQQNYD